MSGVDPQDPLIGKVLGGKYRLEGLLGQGGFGSVYRATQIALESEVAVKVLELPHNPNRQIHAMLVGRFHREAKATSKLKHPHTVTLLDFGDEGDDLLYMVLELLEGETLKELIRREERLPSMRTARIGMQLCRSLSDAHERKILHRDLKPANIVMCDYSSLGDFAKILDFGIARIMAPDGPTADNQEVTAITGTDMLIGTALYMAPEQFEDGKPGPYTDLYALGCILYQMLSGSPPYRRNTPIATMHAHATAPIPELDRDAAPDLTEEERDGWNLILLRLMNKRPEGRAQTAAEVLDLLRPLAHEGLPMEIPERPRGQEPADALADTQSVSSPADGLHDTTPSKRPPVSEAPDPTVNSGPPSMTVSAPAEQGPWWRRQVNLIVSGVVLASIGFGTTQSLRSIRDSQPDPEDARAELNAALAALKEPRTPPACQTRDSELMVALTTAAGHMERGELEEARKAFKSGAEDGALAELATTAMEDEDDEPEKEVRLSQESAELWSLRARERLLSVLSEGDKTPRRKQLCLQAKEYATRAMKLCDSMAAPRITLGNAYFECSGLPISNQAGIKALEEGRERLEAGETERQAYVLFTLAQMEINGDPDKSLGRLDELMGIRKGDEYPGEKRLRGMAHFQLKQWKDAAVHLKTAHEGSPEDAGLHRLLAMSQEKAGEHSAARESFCALADRGEEPSHRWARKQCDRLGGQRAESEDQAVGNKPGKKTVTPPVPMDSPP